MISAVTGKETAFRTGNAPCSWGTLEFEESKGEQAPAVQSDPPPSVVLADANVTVPAARSTPGG